MEQNQQMHNPVPVLDPLYVDYLTQIEIWERQVFESKEFVNLNSTHQKFLRDILDGMLSRYEKGQESGIWDINNIVVRDNVACLPPVSEAEGSSPFHPVQLYFNLVMRVLGTDGRIPARDSFYDLLRVLIHEKDDGICKKGLHALYFHRLLHSSKDNTNLIGDAMAYLRQNESRIEKQLGDRSWQASYTDWSADRTYDIRKSVNADRYFKLVYKYRKEGYSNNCIGLLHFMKNLFKHLNDHRRDDGVEEWSDEQIEMATELYFPGEMDHFYQFLWFVGIPMDFRKSRPRIPPVYQKANTGESPISANSGESLGTSNALPAIRANLATQELKLIKISDLDFKEVLGSGTYRHVYRGIWKAPKESFVAIKEIRELKFSVGQLQRLRADFWKEAQVLNQFHHPNIVEFHGVVTNGPVLATVTEYMESGSLKQVWEGKALDCPRISDYRKKLMIAIDAANGMHHLHRKGIQFLLTSRNLLLDLGDSERPKCKIGDLQLFGFEHRELVAGGVGTRPWLAPELLYSKSNLVTEKANVYSFGIVMGELLFRESPYSHWLPVERLAGIIKANALPSSAYPTWISLLRRCWSSDPESRPPFSEIVMELHAMLAATNKKRRH